LKTSKTNIGDPDSPKLATAQTEGDLIFIASPRNSSPAIFCIDPILIVVPPRVREDSRRQASEFHLKYENTGTRKSGEGRGLITKES